MTAPEFFSYLFPETLLSFLIVAVFLLDLGFKKMTAKTVASMVSGSLFLTLVSVGLSDFHGGAGLFWVDRLSHSSRALVLISGILSIFATHRFLSDRGTLHTEVFHVIAVLTLSILVLVQSSHFLLFFLGLESASICSYILCASRRGHSGSVESAMKYFVLGALSSAFIAYGIALIYGATGSLDFFGIAQSLGQSPPNGYLAVTGLILLLCGMAFKLALFPFHIWSPDVYEGVSVPFTAIFATLVKAGIFVGLFRVLHYALPSLKEVWIPLLAVLSALSMLYGNFAALGQKNLKRLMAYSSIAHSGYMLLAVISSADRGEMALAYYLAGYVVTGLGLFGGLIMLGKEKEILMISDIRGLANGNKLLGFSFALMLMGLAGFPLTAGFIGKIYVFYSGVESGFLWLVAVGILSGIFSIFYYFGIIQSIFKAPNVASKVEFSVSPGISSIKICVYLCALLTFLIGIFPIFFFDLLY